MVLRSCGFLVVVVVVVVAAAFASWSGVFSKVFALLRAVMVTWSCFCLKLRTTTKFRGKGKNT